MSAQHLCDVRCCCPKCGSLCYYAPEYREHACSDPKCAWREFPPSARVKTIERCFACDRPLGARPSRVDTRDGQTVYVGASCFKLVTAAGERGYQPPRGGPRLYLLPEKEL